MADIAQTMARYDAFLVAVENSVGEPENRAATVFDYRKEDEMSNTRSCPAALARSR